MTVYQVAGQAVLVDPSTVHIPVAVPSTPAPAPGDVLVAVVDVAPSPPSLVDLATFRAILDVPDHIASDAELLAVADAASALVLAQLDPTKAPHNAHPWDREGALTVAVDLWQARRAPGGSNAGPEWAPNTSPAMLGPALLMRVVGTLGPCLASGGAVVA